MSIPNVNLFSSVRERRLSQAGVSKNSVQSLTWVISFGDLLTLILCFFVVLLTVKPFGNTQENPPSAGQASGPATAPEAGTPLALSPEKEKGLSFFRQLPDPSPGRLDIPLRGVIAHPGGAAALTRQLQESHELHDLRPRSVRIVLCGEREGWEGLVREVTRALREADLSGLELSLERRGECGAVAVQAVRDRENAEDEVGILSFSQEAE